MKMKPIKLLEEHCEFNEWRRMNKIFEMFAGYGTASFALKQLGAEYKYTC